MYVANNKRYDSMQYRRSGRSGIQLPAVSLGLWHNFGGVDNFENSRAMLRRAFDLGITHFDLANNYGPPYGSAEETCGQILKKDFRPYRDELIISTKAGWDMWPGPYGNLGSRKYMLASLDQSLKRMGLEYVDIFYHHRPDPDTPMEESLGALDTAVRSGRALYAGISAYNAKQTAEAIRILRDLGTPCLIHQPKYSMFVRDPEQGLLDVLEKEGVGTIVFSPLAQGLLSDRYLHGIPSDSRAARDFFLKKKDIGEAMLSKVRTLNEIAAQRGQTLAAMAVAWVLRDPRVTSALVGTSKVSQVDDNVAALQNLKFSAEELRKIDGVLEGKKAA
ncbi:MAG TPA: L-glyceraldehyde 3-phosphate reductase [Terriglobales bacterium]|jgi:L-glyceraldehyde 3-phosphate reductase|nr:L-glyceraldehyde 3-phosphate reductase [Terriglobales bacterium]